MQCQQKGERNTRDSIVRLGTYRKKRRGGGERIVGVAVRERKEAKVFGLGT